MAGVSIFDLVDEKKNITIASCRGVNALGTTINICVGMQQANAGSMGGKLGCKYVLDVVIICTYTKSSRNQQ